MWGKGASGHRAVAQDGSTEMRIVKYDYRIGVALYDYTDGWTWGIQQGDIHHGECTPGKFTVEPVYGGKCVNCGAKLPPGIELLLKFEAGKIR